MYLTILITWLFLTASANATVVIYPKFEGLVRVGSRIVTTSPDARRLMCFDLNGKLVWQKRFRQPIYAGPFDAESILYQSGANVSVMNAGSGRSRRIARVGGQNEVFQVSDGAVWSLAWEKAVLRWRNPKTMRVEWQRERVEQVSEISNDLVFVTTAERHPERHGWTFSGTRLEALDRKTGVTRWSVPSKEPQMPGIAALSVSPWVVISDWTKLLVAEEMTGKVLASREAMPASILGYIRPVLADRNLITIELGPDPDRLLVLELPNLREIRAFDVPVRENSDVFVHQGLAVTRGIYGVAVFDFTSGAKLWERDQQLAISEPEDGEAYASDWTGTHARLFLLNLRTGQERELYREAAAMPEPDRKAIAKFEKEQNREDVRRLVPIGRTICLRYGSAITGRVEYLRLNEGGDAEYVVVEDGRIDSRHRGHWSATNGEYSVRLAANYRDVISGRMHVLVTHPAILELLPEFRDRVDATLAAEPERETFDAASLRKMQSVAPCPAGAEDSCTTYGELHVGLSGDIEYQNLGGNVSRHELLQLVRDLDLYIANPDKDLFRFRLQTHRGFTFADMRDAHFLWPSSEDADHIRSQINRAADSGEEPGGGFIVIRCENYQLPK